MVMKLKKIAIVVVSCLLAVSGLYAGYRHMARQDMIRCTLEWDRLARFPDSEKHFSITTEGGPFTRAFRVYFSADPAVIEDWVDASPGLKDHEPERPEPKRRMFIIEPGGGAQYAEVEIDDKSNVVRVYVYWS